MSDTAHSWRRTSQPSTTTTTTSNNHIPNDSNRQTITTQKNNESNDILEKMNRLDMETSPHDSVADDSKRKDRRRDTRGRRSMAPPPKVINSRAALLGEAPDVVLGGNAGSNTGRRGGSEVRQTMLVY